jgi:ectoine hydroxylase-related dioxygenase (phytanoyl-CoA dioxygenase family)
MAVVDTQSGDTVRSDAAFFRAHGWVRAVEVLTPAEVVAAREELLRLASEEDAFEHAAVGAVSDPRFRAALNVVPDPSRRSEVFAELVRSRRLAELVCSIVGLECRGLRFFRDLGFIKPSVEAGQGMGAETGFHQDYPYWPVDRRGGCSVWVALMDLPVNSGTLQFVDESHTWGPLGRYDSVNTDWRSEHPEVPVTEPHALQAGSGTIHDGLTLHGASRNENSEPRLGYSITYLPADALYTGAPSRFTDDLGLAVNEPLNHERFPLVVPPRPSPLVGRSATSLVAGDAHGWLRGR